MAEDNLSTIIGKPTGTTVVTVERGQLALFAAAVKDDSPIYRDARAATAAGLAGIPAPPTYPFVMENFGAYPELQTDGRADGQPDGRGPRAPHGQGRPHPPRRAGVHLPPAGVRRRRAGGEGTVVDAYRKESKGKTMTFVVVETAWRDRATGEPVCTSRMNIIHRV